MINYNRDGSQSHCKPCKIKSEWGTFHANHLECVAVYCSNTSSHSCICTSATTTGGS